MPRPVQLPTKPILKPSATASRPQLLFYKYEANPNPNNVATPTHTRILLSDPSSPRYIAAQRQIAAFDPRLFHWSVKASADLSKKAVVRNWAIRRVREAFAQALRDRGFERNGRLKASSRDGQALRGALGIQLDKNGRVITASGQEVRAEADKVLDSVITLARKRCR